MQIVDGDLWDYYAKGWRVVVTTNVGWHPVSLANNMGAGVALQAARRWPDLPVWYGRRCMAAMTTDGYMPVVLAPARRLVFLPVKPLLDPENPERSWDQMANLQLIDLGLQQLRRGLRSGSRIAMSFPGCGNGGLRERSVARLIERHLGHAVYDGRVCVVRWVPRLVDSALV